MKEPERHIEIQLSLPERIYELTDGYAMYGGWQPTLFPLEPFTPEPPL